MKWIEVAVSLASGMTIILFPISMNADPGKGPGCDYTPGDINHNGSANGIDVVYGINYLKGGPPPSYQCACPPHGDLYVEADVNGSYEFNGLDITYFIRFLQGGPPLQSCPTCPPIG